MSKRSSLDELLGATDLYTPDPLPDELLVPDSEEVDAPDGPEPQADGDGWTGPRNEAGKPNRMPSKGDRRRSNHPTPRAGGRRFYDLEAK